MARRSRSGAQLEIRLTIYSGPLGLDGCYAVNFKKHKSLSNFKQVSVFRAAHHTQIWIKFLEFNDQLLDFHVRRIAEGHWITIPIQIIR